MTSELVFAFDPCSYSEVYHVLQSDDCDQIAAAPQNPNDNLAALESFSIDALGLPMFEKTLLQREVMKLLTTLELKHRDRGGSFGLLGAPTHVAKNIEELCLTMRLRGVDARMYLPSPQDGSACARRSTGGGGNCTAVGGLPCFFCSRQPYAIVLGSPAPCRPPPGRSGQQHSSSTSAGGVGSVESGALLVEPCLREIFRAAPTTAEYAAIVEQLPEVWVGPRSALLALAGRMCSAMAVNFRSQGLDVPPWRRRSAVLARWDESHQLELCTPPDHPQQPRQSSSQCSRSRQLEAIAEPYQVAESSPQPGIVSWPSAEQRSTSQHFLASPGDGVIRRHANAATASCSPLRRYGVSGPCGDQPNLQLMAAQGSAARPLAPAVVVYGFDLPCPARAG